MRGYKLLRSHWQYGNYWVLDYMAISMKYPGYYVVSAMSLLAKWMIITPAWQIHLTSFASWSDHGMSVGRMVLPGVDALFSPQLCRIPPVGPSIEGSLRTLYESPRPWKQFECSRKGSSRARVQLEGLCKTLELILQKLFAVSSQLYHFCLEYYKASARQLCTCTIQWLSLMTDSLVLCITYGHLELPLTWSSFQTFLD